jgi:AraC-like DNA-binding protein
MIEIKRITSVDELYKNGGAPTGQIPVDAVVDYVKRVKSHSAEDVATYLGQKRVWLSGVLQMLVGVPLQEFIIQWRVLQALDLLDDPELSVAEVAKACGFRNEKNLVDTLRRRVGITPNAYRTGSVPHNGNYSFNKDPHARRKLFENVEKLKSRRQESAPEGE